MDILWHVVRISMGLVETTILIMLLDVFLVKKNQQIGKQLTIILGIVAVLYTISQVIEPGPLKYVIATFLGTILACWLYEGSLIKKFLSILLFIVSSVVIEIFIGNWFVEFSLMDMNDMVVRNTAIVLITVATKSIQFIGINLMRRIKNKEDIKFNVNEILVYVAPCSTIAIVSILIKYQTNHYRPAAQLISIICVCMGLLISNVFIWLMFEKMIEQDRERRRYEEIQDKIKKQYKYYRNIESRQEEGRRMWHDINNHLGCIRRLIDNHHPEQATEYLNKINFTINRLRGTIDTGNLILDAILNDKYEMAQINEIDMVFEVNQLEIDFVDSMDICTIYGNLLDNAIEACMKIVEGQREIRVISKNIKGFVVIKIINTTKDKVIIKNNRMTTSKLDGYNHGIGLINVSDTVEKYNGNITMECENNKFITSVLLPVVECPLM